MNEKNLDLLQLIERLRKYSEQEYNAHNNYIAEDLRDAADLLMQLVEEVKESLYEQEGILFLSNYCKHMRVGWRYYYDVFCNKSLSAIQRRTGEKYFSLWCKFYAWFSYYKNRLLYAFSP